MSEFVLTGKALQHLMASILDAGSGHRVRVRGRGFSMIPFVKDNSAVILKRVNRHRGIKFGDIVAVSNREKTRALIHRVIRSKGDRYQTKGDGNKNPDPWCEVDDIIGTVDAVENTGWIPYNNARWQNVLIAIASRTGVLTRMIYPGFTRLRNLIK